MVLGYEQTPTVTEKFKSAPKKRTAYGQSSIGGNWFEKISPKNQVWKMAKTDIFLNWLVYHQLIHGITGNSRFL